MKRYFIPLATLLFLVGCATHPPAVSTYYDPVMGRRTDLLADNVLETSGPLRELIELNAFRDWKNSDQSVYYLEVIYTARSEVGYLEIPPGQMLTVIADGQPIKFDGSGSMNMRKLVKKELPSEKAFYLVSKRDLQKIAAAQKVKVQIKGNKGLVERDFAKDNLDKFRQFVSTYAQ